MRRTLRILSVTLMTAGTVILADVGATLAWKEPLSAAYGQLKQSAASDQLQAQERAFFDSPDVTDLEPDRNTERQARKLARLYAEQITNGEGIGRISVPGIGIDFVLIEGTDTADLQKGPGRYPTTGLPGQGRTIGIAGHRTTYLAPFREIAEIEIGDRVMLEMPYGRFAYEVIKTAVVDPGDVGIVDDVGSERLVLTACHPLYSAAERYAVTAELIDTKLNTRPAQTPGG